MAGKGSNTCGGMVLVVAGSLLMVAVIVYLFLAPFLFPASRATDLSYGWREHGASVVQADGVLREYSDEVDRSPMWTQGTVLGALALVGGFALACVGASLLRGFAKGDGNTPGPSTADGDGKTNSAERKDQELATQGQMSKLRSDLDELNDQYKKLQETVDRLDGRAHPAPASAFCERTKLSYEHDRMGSAPSDSRVNGDPMVEIVSAAVVEAIDAGEAQVAQADAGAEPAE